ncbi:MAG: 4Fe-4S binding protein [Oscillospiraceae bacterium]|nr:4Fe-4S binding protein [Oscillospiraceae bacterium]
MKAFVVDVAKCTGCYNCQLACKTEHAENDWMPYTKPQPKTGHFWCKLEEHVRGSRPKLDIYYLSRHCNHCENPSCIPACPEHAITKRPDGLVEIDQEKCSGCRECLAACPYEAIYFNDECGVAQKCTGCAHLLDNTDLIPRCVDACPTGTIKFGEKEELMDDIEGAETLMPETGCRPQVYYRNIPRQFVAGTVYDPESEEIIEGARCRLTQGPRGWDAYTDDFGDFWIKDIPVGIYDLIITAPGYKLKAFYGLRTRECQNLGDIAMEKE